MALSQACEEAIAPAAIAAGAGGSLQPLLGVYGPAALPRLRAAPAGSRLTAVVEALEPETVACRRLCS